MKNVRTIIPYVIVIAASLLGCDITELESFDFELSAPIDHHQITGMEEVNPSFSFRQTSTFRGITVYTSKMIEGGGVSLNGQEMTPHACSMWSCEPGYSLHGGEVEFSVPYRFVFTLSNGIKREWMIRPENHSVHALRAPERHNLNRDLEFEFDIVPSQGKLTVSFLYSTGTGSMANIHFVMPESCQDEGRCSISSSLMTAADFVTAETKTAHLTLSSTNTVTDYSGEIAVEVSSYSDAVQSIQISTSDG